jgi:glycosyltransferase involved in cell wall biosynthesis
MSHPLIDKTKPRILVSGHLPPPMGGIATYYQSLLNSSLPQRVDLCFVETSSQKRTQAQSGRFSFSNLVSALSDCGRFTNAVIKHRPQLCHIATADGLSFGKHGVCVIIARLFGSRVLLHPHCGFSVLYTDQPRWWQWFFRTIIRMTNGVVTLSTEWNQLTAILPGSSVYFLPNGIDLSAYRAVGLERRVVAKEPHHLKVLYLGYLGKAKGSFDLVEAAIRISNDKLPVVFDLVGGDWAPGEVEQVKKQVDQAGLGNIVSLHPPVVGAQKIDYFREADIFIYPSYSEGMPIAVIEAMACGLPIIASRVGGLPDLVIDGINGILVDAGSPDQLATAIKYLSTDPDLRIEMQLKSFQRAFDKFDIEKIVPRLIDIYERTLKGGSV